MLSNTTAGTTRAHRPVSSLSQFFASHTEVLPVVFCWSKTVWSV
jgi:hypothetical protein